MKLFIRSGLAAVVLSAISVAPASAALLVDDGLASNNCLIAGHDQSYINEDPACEVSSIIYTSDSDSVSVAEESDSFY